MGLREVLYQIRGRRHTNALGYRALGDRADLATEDELQALLAGEYTWRAGLGDLDFAPGPCAVSVLYPGLVASHCDARQEGAHLKGSLDLPPLSVTALKVTGGSSR